MKRALITGITGQDGSYLAEFLLAKGYEVHGVIRRASTFNTTRIDHLYSDPHDPETRLFLHYGDLSDASGLRHILARVRPVEIYNLAAQSHVKVSFDQPEYTADIVATGTLRLLEATREYIATAKEPVRFYQAGSSEMYGSAPRRKAKQRLLRRVALTLSEKWPDTGLPPTIAKPTICSFRTAFCSITKVRVEAKRL